MGSRDLERRYPGLRTSAYRIRGVPSRVYNCFAWAEDNISEWREPPEPGERFTWPAGIPRDTALDTLVLFFALRGYEECDADLFEPGIEKVALYTLNGQTATHAAWQMDTGDMDEQDGFL